MRREIILEVPFKEKDEAKMLGARWDPDIKKWFVPSGQNPRPFTRWMQSDRTEDLATDSHKNNKDQQAR